jgi:hypothetical protein
LNAGSTGPYPTASALADVTEDFSGHHAGSSARRTVFLAAIAGQLETFFAIAIGDTI